MSLKNALKITASIALVAGAIYSTSLLTSKKKAEAVEAAAPLAFAAAAPEKGILFENNFDDKKDKFSWIDKCCDYSFTIDSTHNWGNFGKSQRVELRKNETQMGNTDGKRADASWNSQAYQQETHTGQGWWRITVTLDSSWVVDNLPPNGNPESIMGMHDGEPCSNRATNPFGVWVNGDHFEAFVANMDPNGPNYCDVSSPKINVVNRWNLGKWKVGVPYTFILRFRNKNNSSGFDSLFDGSGKLLFAYNGNNWYKGIFAEPYLKQGIYKWGWKAGWPTTTDKRILYQDNIKIGDSTCTLSQFILNSPTPPQNVAPKADAGADQTTAPGATAFTVSGKGTDVDGTITKYFWQIKSTPTNWFGTSTNQIWNLTDAIPGVYVIELTVTDDKQATGKDTVVVTIPSTNKPPVIANITATPSQVVTIPVSTITMSVIATDADGDSLSYKWDSAGTVVGLMSSYTKKFTSAFNGQYRCTVTDSKGNSTNAVIAITVNPIPPKLIINSSVKINPKTGGQIVTLNYADGTFKNVEGDVIIP